MTVRILLADDHKMMRQALRTLLSGDKRLTIVAEADDGLEVLDKIDKAAPDIVLMDVNMPNMNGIETTKILIERHPGIKVVGLSAYIDKRFVMGMLEAGAVGYIVKAEAGDELFRAINAVMKGQNYLCPLVSESLFKDGREDSKESKPALSTREQEVLVLLAQGLHSHEIGKRLGIAASTVEVHRRNIMRKLGLRGIAELTKYAIRESLIAV